jgi:hypothetical protein
LPVRRLTILPSQIKLNNQGEAQCSIAPLNATAPSERSPYQNVKTCKLKMNTDAAKNPSPTLTPAEISRPAHTPDVPAENPAATNEFSDAAHASDPGHERDRILSGLAEHHPTNDHQDDHAHHDAGARHLLAAAGTLRTIHESNAALSQILSELATETRQAAAAHGDSLRAIHGAIHELRRAHQEVLSRLNQPQGQ